MPHTKGTHTVSSHFEKSTPAVKATYKAILQAARELGPVREEAKKTSIHLVRDTAFAGIATRKEALILTLKAERPLKSSRVGRAEQTSANRWHLELKLSAPTEVDAELRGWIEQAYRLA